MKSRKRGFGRTTQAHQTRSGMWKRHVVEAVNFGRQAANVGLCAEALMYLRQASESLGQFTCHYHSAASGTDASLMSAREAVASLRSLIEHRCLCGK